MKNVFISETKSRSQSRAKTPKKIKKNKQKAKKLAKTIQKSILKVSQSKVKSSRIHKSKSYQTPFDTSKGKTIVMGRPSYSRMDLVKSFLSPGFCSVAPRNTAGKLYDGVIPFCSRTNNFLDNIISIKSDGSFDQSYTLEPPGSSIYRYLVFGVVPSATVFPDTIGSGPTSGCFIFQTNNLDCQIFPQSMYTYTPLAPSKYGQQTLFNVLGTTNTDIAKDTVLFSTRMQIDLIASEMNKAHDAFYGSLSMGMFVQDKDQNSSNTITVRKMVQLASFKHSECSSFWVQEHIRNMDIIGESHRIAKGDSDLTVNVGTVEQEMFSYCVVCAPSRPVLTTSSVEKEYAPYSIQVSYNNNGVMYPITNPIVRALATKTDVDDDIHDIAESAVVAKALPNANLQSVNRNVTPTSMIDGLWNKATNIASSSFVKGLGRVADYVVRSSLYNHNPYLRPLMLQAKSELSPVIFDPSAIYDYLVGEPNSVLLQEKEFIVADPEYQDVINAYQKSLKELTKQMQGKSSYLYPKIKYDQPEKVVGANPRETYQLVMKGSFNIPSLQYCQNIGWILTSSHAESFEWFNKFLFLLDDQKNPQAHIPEEDKESQWTEIEEQKTGVTYQPEPPALPYTGLKGGARDFLDIATRPDGSIDEALVTVINDHRNQILPSISTLQKYHEYTKYNGPRVVLAGREKNDLSSLDTSLDGIHDCILEQNSFLFGGPDGDSCVAWIYNEDQALIVPPHRPGIGFRRREGHFYQNLAFLQSQNQAVDIALYRLDGNRRLVVLSWRVPVKIITIQYSFKNAKQFQNGIKTLASADLTMPATCSWSEHYLETWEDLLEARVREIERDRNYRPNIDLPESSVVTHIYEGFLVDEPQIALRWNDASIEEDW